MLPPSTEISHGIIFLLLLRSFEGSCGGLDLLPLGLYLGRELWLRFPLVFLACHELNHAFLGEGKELSIFQPSLLLRNSALLWEGKWGAILLGLRFVLRIEAFTIKAGFFDVLGFSIDRELVPHLTDKLH